MTDAFKARGQQVIQQVVATTEETTSELTEEAIITSVDQAINVIQIAGQQVRERNIPTENVALEVSVKIMGVVELKMRADVPKQEQLRVDSNGKNSLNSQEPAEK